MNLWTRLGIATILAGAAVLAATALGAPEALFGAGSAVRLLEPSQNAELGQTVQLQVKVEGVTNLATWEVKLGYDPDILDYQGWTTTDFLASSGRSPICPSAVEDADVGWTLVGCGSSAFTPAGPDGSAVVATVTFKAVGTGTTPVEILKRELANPEGENCCGDPATYEAVVRVYGDEEEEPEDLPPTPTPNTKKLTPTAVPASALTGTPVSRFGQATPPAGTVAGTSGSSGSGAVRGVGSGAADADNNFPVAGYGPQDDHAAWPEQIATGLVLAGAVLVLVGARTTDRRHAG
jgi:hypothetical protein